MAESHTEKSPCVSSGLSQCHVQLTDGKVTKMHSSNAQELSRPDIPENPIPFRQMSKVSGLSASAIAQLEESGDGLSELACCKGESKHENVSRTAQSFENLADERQPRSGIREACADAEPQVQCISQGPQKYKIFPSLLRGIESLGSNLSIVEGSPDNSFTHSGSALEPVNRSSADVLADSEKEELFKENRSEEAIWNEQVIKQVLEEPPLSFQGRILDAFSLKRREKQRIEETEIAIALAEMTAETDVVMFQRPHSSSDLVSLGVDVPVVAFDDFQEEQTSEFKKLGAKERPLGQRSSLIGEDGRTPVGGRKLDQEDISYRLSTDGELSVKHPDAVKELTKRPRSNFLHSIESVSTNRGLFGHDPEPDVDKDIPRSSTPRSWLWSRKVQRQKFVGANDDTAGTCGEPETPKSIQSSATGGYELFLQEADMASSPRSRLSQLAPQPEGFLDF